jgi:hypothetical protein
MRSATQDSSPRRVRSKLTAGVVAGFVLLGPALVLASDVDVAVVDVTTPTSAVTLAPGASGSITINMSVTGNQSGTATFEVYRNWTLSGGTFTGSNPQEFAVAPRAGGDPATTLSTTGTVTVAAGQSSGTFTLAVGAFDITNTNTSGAKLAAGDSSSYSVTVTAPADTTPPVITPTVVGTVGTNGWYTSDVTVSWSVVDGQSSISSSSGCDSTTVDADTPGVTFTCSATSAGGTDSKSVTITRDATAPTISGSASPAANGAGWNKTDVTVSFSCGDGTSGVASCGPNTTLTDDGADQSVMGTAVDGAGNTSTATVSGIDIDKTAPVVSVTGVANGATYTLGSVPLAGCSTSDALSGVKTSATAGAPAGGPVGSVTVTCAGAEDNAGNTNSASATYQVVYAWTGFFQPVDNPTIVAGQITNFGWNKAKAGSAIPVKFDLGGNQGLDIFAAGYPKVTSVVCNTAATNGDLVEETVTANTSGLKYDPLAGQYVYVWKTATTFAGKCFRLDVKLVDDTTHSAYFNFTK